MNRLKPRVSILAVAAVVAVVVFASFVTTAEARGGGHGLGIHLGHAPGAHAFAYSNPPGWSRGRKVGWRGYDCPPGLAKQGRC